MFAGCLINSHDIDPSKSKLTGSAAAIERRLRANIKAHPNLADYVKSRMVATGTSVEMHAANASTVFSTFNLDPATGKAQLSDTSDPDIGGTKLGYVRTGTEPEGVLRAALECCADEKIGIASTTAEMEKRVKVLAGATSQGEGCVRVAFELALHKGAGHNVDVAMLADLLHRIKHWGEAYADTPAQRLADAVKKPEAAKIFPALLAVGYGDNADANYYQSWMKFDPGQGANFMAKLGASGMTVEQFKIQLSRKILDPHLATLLPISAAPTQAQMLLALTIADGDGSVPSHVREFLIKAAGGTASRAFPAALNVGTLFPNGEGLILERIGLSDKAPPAPGVTIDGNADLNHDGKNESHIDVNPHKAKVTAHVLNVRERATTSSHVIGTLKKDAAVRVAGSTRNGHWSMIDFDGKVGFVSTHYLKQA
ncbi:MAG: SH3 domain-containing protein [Deltaproteobacteria bacterium]|nr:SH3 domain-containing protein [Deltaproteobacteria bacterium]